MTRVGWVVLAGILLVAGLFASLLSLSRAPNEARVAVSVPTPSGPGLQVPVAHVARSQITDTWGQTRAEGRTHHGTDIPAPGGTPVLAAAGGTIEKLFQSRLGGTTLYERSPDGHWTYYYAHLAGYAPGMREGLKVRAGQLLGFVGDTGDAGPGNTHLHFSLTRTNPDQNWWEGEDVNAFPFLRDAGRPLP